MIYASTGHDLPIQILDFGLLAILVVVAFSILRMRSLFAIVMLQGVYSLVSAAWFVSLDAVDVAFTEAAVGAGVSTVLMLSAMLLADRQSEPVPMKRQLGPLAIVIIAGAAMLYAVGDMPAYGSATSPANSYVGMEYIDRTAEDIHIPNVVTAVLASYRGYDTFGETVVIFAAGLGVLLLLGLNGNAGRWRANPNGQRISNTAAPTVLNVHSPLAASEGTSPEPRHSEPRNPEPPEPAASKAPRKKAATKKTADKETTVKKPTKPKGAK